MNMNGILVKLSESPRTSFGKENFVDQSFPQRVFSAIWAVESEVNNGGFSQYFLNDSGETAVFAVEALQSIGAPQTANICERAIATAFPAGIPSDPDEVRAAARQFPEDVAEQLGSLDEEFFQYPHDLTELLFIYVSQHPEEFGELAKPDDRLDF